MRRLLYAGYLSGVRRLLPLVLACGLIFIGGATASAPLSIRVTHGTVMHGDTASLSTIDGDTLDIDAVQPNGFYDHWIVEFQANYGTGFHHVYLHYGFWKSGGNVKCSFKAAHLLKFSTRPIRTIKAGTWDYGPWDPNVDFALKVHCGASQSVGTYTVNFDQLSADETP